MKIGQKTQMLSTTIKTTIFKIIGTTNLSDYGSGKGDLLIYF